MPNTVREPIQTYLSGDERDELDAVAAELGISRSEVLRRGVRALRTSRSAGPLRDLAEGGLVTPATAPPGSPPPSVPVASLDEILRELGEDRSAR